jgi:hypothetical protein
LLNKALKYLPLVFLAGFGYAEQVQVSSFKLLNNNESSLIIQPEQAQDLLNVDVTPGGKSVKKRSGYGLYKALSTAQAVHGGAHFFDSTGNDVQVWGSSTSLYGIVADGTPTQLISSATLNSTWDCADTQGNAYCVNSNRNAYIRTDGATKTWFSSPLGTMAEATPDRVAVAGVSGTPNTIYFSESGTFTNFVVGLNTTSPFSEVIASQGSKITHIRWACGKLLWWKDQSFGYINGSDQFNLESNIVSDNVGTFDNTSALDPGGSVWFRGQDGHIWKYDCSALTKETVEITPLAQASSKRVSNFWNQTSQSDFASGAVSMNGPSVSLSTAITAGVIVPSSFTAIDTDSTTFALGTTVNVTIGNSSVGISTNNSGTIYNNDFENAATLPTDGFGGIFLGTVSSCGTCACTVSPFSGSQYARRATLAGTRLTAAKVYLVDATTDAPLTSQTFACNSSCSGWTQGTFTDASYAGKRVKFAFGAADVVTTTSTTKSSYIFSGRMTFYYRCDNTDAINNNLSYDLVEGASSTITAGSFTSRTIDTRFTSSTLMAQASWTVNTSTPIFVVQHSTAVTGPWATLLTSTNTNAVANRYIRYVSSFTVGGTDNALSTFNDASFIASSSGTFYSAVKNAPNIASWSTFSGTVQNNGGTHAFFMRSSTNSFAVLSSTPSWTAQSNGSLVVVSTGTYFQVRDDFGIATATDTPTLSDFTVNWYEGSASDQAYSIYFDNSILFSVAYGAGQATNNYIFKNDLINDGWTIYNFGTGGFSIQNNALYFGDTASGNVFKYGTQSSDNGSAINSYWKSKDFTGQDPWLENQYKQLDSYFTKSDNATASVSYSLNTTSNTTSFNVSLSSTTQSIIVNKKLLPSGKYGNTFNYKVSDNSTNAQWEFLGFRMTYEPQPYRPSN